MFHISSTIVFFSYGKVKDVSFGDKDQISSGEGKGRVTGDIIGRSPKRGFIFAKFPLLHKIQTLSHKHLVRQTSIHHHCDQHAQKPI